MEGLFVIAESSELLPTDFPSSKASSVNRENCIFVAESGYFSFLFLQL